MTKFRRLYQERFTEIGTIRRAHGYKGHAKLFLEENYISTFGQQEFVFIETEGYKVPFKIESFEVGRDIIIKLKGIDNSEDLNKYHMSSLHVLSSDIRKSDSGLDGDIDKLVGFQIIDVNKQLNVGTILRVDQYPQQKMAIIIKDNVEILIPLHTDLILSNDMSTKEIHMDLPEGLV